MKRFLLIYLFLTAKTFAATQAQLIPWDGILTNNANAPITTPVNITFALYDPAVTCLLYEETHASIAPSADGAVGLMIGGGTPTGNNPGLNFSTIFQNGAQIRAVSSANCTGGYTSAAGDKRILRVTVGAEVLSPDLEIGSTPSAFSAETLQGKVPTDFLTTAGGTSSGSITIQSANGIILNDTANSFGVTLKGPSTLGGAVVLTLPTTVGSANQVLTTDGVGNLSWTTAGGGAVTTVFGRTGAVVGAAGDYTATLITSTATGTVSATDVQSAIAELDAEKMTSTLASGSIFVGNGSNVATAVTISGDATLSNTGVLTLTASPTISSTQIIDGSIVDADIAASGGISAAKITTTATGSVSSTNVDAAIAELEAEKLALTGGTMTGSLTMGASLNMNSNALTNASNITTTDLTVDTNTLYVDSTNNRIGIGTTSPSATLDISSTTSGLLVPTMDATAMNAISTPPNGLMIYNTTGSRHYYYNGTNWQGIGDSGVKDSDGNTKIQVEETTNDDTIRFDTAGTEQMTINASGSIYIASLFGGGTLTADGSGNLSISSDMRLKKDIEKYETGLDSILRLNPKTYKWNEKSGLETSGTYAGFIAQEVRPLIPYAVNEGKDGYLKLSDRPILAAVVNATKEQQQQIEVLKNENKQLKQEIEFIKTVICDENPSSAICL